MITVCNGKCGANQCVITSLVVANGFFVLAVEIDAWAVALVIANVVFVHRHRVIDCDDALSALSYLWIDFCVGDHETCCDDDHDRATFVCALDLWIVDAHDIHLYCLRLRRRRHLHLCLVIDAILWAIAPCDHSLHLGLEIHS